MSAPVSPNVVAAILITQYRKTMCGTLFLIVVLICILYSSSEFLCLVGGVLGRLSQRQIWDCRQNRPKDYSDLAFQLILRYRVMFTCAYACAAIYALIFVKDNGLFPFESVSRARLYTSLAFRSISATGTDAPAVFPATFIVIDFYHCLTP